MSITRIILSILLIAAVFTPMVLAANSVSMRTFAEKSQRSRRLEYCNEDRLQQVECSGKCETCSNTDCQLRRKPYRGKK